MARFGRLKGKAKAQPQEQLRVLIPQPKEATRKGPKPLSPKNEWVTNVQALKHEYQEKAGGSDENKRKKKDNSIKVEGIPDAKEKLILHPPSATNQRSPKAVRSPSNSAPSSPKTTRSSPREARESRSPKSASSSSHCQSPRSSTQLVKKDRYSPRHLAVGVEGRGQFPRSPKSSTTSPRSHREDHSTLDLRRKEKLLSKSAKSKSSKKYSSTLNVEKQKPKADEKTPKPAIEMKMVLEEPQETEERDDMSTPKERGASTKRETVLGVLLAEPPSPLPTPRMPPLVDSETKPATTSAVDPSTQQQVPKASKKQGWFGFRKGKGKDPSSKPPPPTLSSGKDGASKPPTPQPKARTPRDSSSARVSTAPSAESSNIGPSPAPPQVQQLAATSPLQLQLWLGAVKSSIVRVRPDDVKAILASSPKRTTTPRATPRGSSNPATTTSTTTPRSNATPHTPLEAIAEEQDANNNYFLNAQEYGVYVDYSTFDDDNSVSSIALLFKWLTCRDLGDGTRQRTKSEGGNPEGMVVSDHEVIDSDVSFDAEAQPRRRVLFSP